MELSGESEQMENIINKHISHYKKDNKGNIFEENLHVDDVQGYTIMEADEDDGNDDDDLTASGEELKDDLKSEESTEQAKDILIKDIYYYKKYNQDLSFEENLEEVEEYMVVKADDNDDDNSNNELNDNDQVVVSDGTFSKQVFIAHNEVGLEVDKSECVTHVNTEKSIVSDKQQIELCLSKVSDSDKMVIVKTEDDVIQPTSDLPYMKQEELAGILGSVKEEVLERCNELENSKCQICGLTFTNYLQYLDHRLLCFNRKNQDIEVKIERDETGDTSCYSNFNIDETEMKNETVPTVETEVDDDDDNILRMEQPDNIRDNIAYTQILPLHDDNNVAIGNNSLQSPTAYSPAAVGNNIAVGNNSAVSNSMQYSHPLPQLLIQNSSVGEEAVEVEEFTLTCFYCKKIFPVEDKISYIQHVQVKHLNGINRIYRAEFLRSKFEELKRYFEQAIWHDLGRTVKMCRRKDCKYIFIDMSYMIKHDLKVHKHHKYVCSIADCHRVFSSKGPWRSHEIVDHAKTATIKKNEGDSNEHVKEIDNIKHFKQTNDEVSDGLQSAKKRSIVNNLTDAEKSVHNRESDQGELPEIPKKKNRKSASDIDDETVNDFDTIDKDMVYDENEKGDPFQRFLYKHVGQAEEIPKPIKQVSNRKKKCRRKAVFCMEGTDKCNNINDNSVKLYPCRNDGCSMVFISNEERVDHVKNFHILNMYNEVKRQRKLTFKCMSVGCEKIFDTKEERKQHVQECHMLGNVKS